LDAPTLKRPVVTVRCVTVLPKGSVLVRTWFGDSSAWERLVSQVRTPSEDGFLAYVTFVDDPTFEGLNPEGLQAMQPDGPMVSFIADKLTLTSDDQPILAVWVLPRDAEDHEPEPYPFRVVPSQLWGVENNINLGNMDWEEFTRSVDEDGTFRGF
jgi:hypothetical protein